MCSFHWFSIVVNTRLVFRDSLGFVPFWVEFDVSRPGFEDLGLGFNAGIVFQSWSDDQGSKIRLGSDQGSKSGLVGQSGFEE